VIQRTLALDALVATVLAALWLIMAPGLAIVAISALVVVLATVISFAVDARRRRRSPTRTRRER
jgi:ABC-type bacteriocin/lantibiotic exporter with double-glycine peptidase domain